MGSISDYGGDSVSLMVLGELPFTVVKVEHSSYEDKKGVKITTKEEFEIDGTRHQKFHTTRTAVVSTLTKEAIFNDINENGKPLGPVHCVPRKSKKGNDYFDLVDYKEDEPKASATPQAEPAVKKAVAVAH